MYFTLTAVPVSCARQCMARCGLQFAAVSRMIIVNSSPVYRRIAQTSYSVVFAQRPLLVMCRLRGSGRKVLRTSPRAQTAAPGETAPVCSPDAPPLRDARSGSGGQRGPAARRAVSVHVSPLSPSVTRAFTWSQGCNADSEAKK